MVKNGQILLNKNERTQCIVIKIWFIYIHQTKLKKFNKISIFFLIISIFLTVDLYQKPLKRYRAQSKQ